MWRPILPCVSLGVAVVGHDHLARQVHAQRGGGFGVGQVGAGQVGAAAQQLGQRGGEGFQRDLEALREATVSALLWAVMVASTAVWAKCFGSSPFMRRVKLLGQLGVGAL
jgi:hypothetical protein